MSSGSSSPLPYQLPPCHMSLAYADDPSWINATERISALRLITSPMWRIALICDKHRQKRQQQRQSQGIGLGMGQRDSSRRSVATCGGSGRGSNGNRAAVATLPNPVVGAAVAAAAAGDVGGHPPSQQQQPRASTAQQLPPATEGEDVLMVFKPSQVCRCCAPARPRPARHGLACALRLSATGSRRACLLLLTTTSYPPACLPGVVLAAGDLGPLLPALTL